MAVYEYRCLQCKKPFTLTVPIGSFDPAKVKCPRCRKKKIERRYSTVFAVTSKKS